jgi:hypothetical protein
MKSFNDRFELSLAIKKNLRGEFSPDISDIMRIGNDSQQKIAKHELEQLPMFDYQFGYLLKPHQTEVNLDIPRGGNATRKDKVIDSLNGFDRKAPSISNPLYNVKTPMLQPVPTLENTPNIPPQKGFIQRNIEFRY